MAINIKQQTASLTELAIQGEMTIYTALEQKKALFDCLKTSKELHIDLSRVDELDSAGLQVLLFMKREASKRQTTFCLTQHSQAVVEAFELLDLGKHFGDPIVLSANWKQP